MQEQHRPNEPAPEKRQRPGDSVEHPDTTQAPTPTPAPAPASAPAAPTAPAVPAPTTRASDADRDSALSILNAAMANGRLDQAEHDTRTGAALAARTLGELSSLTDDLPEAETHAREVRREEQRRKDLKHRAGEWRSWLGAALVMNVIWAVSSVSGGELASYWPVYPLAIWGAFLLSATLRPTDSTRHDRGPRRH